MHALRAVLTGGLLGRLSAPKPEVTLPADDADPAVTVRAYNRARSTSPRKEAVRWVFEGQNEHDVVAVDASFVSECIRRDSFTHVFDEASCYEHDCSIHAEMKDFVNLTETDPCLEFRAQRAPGRHRFSDSRYPLSLPV